MAGEHWNFDSDYGLFSPFARRESPKRDALLNVSPITPECQQLARKRSPHSGEGIIL